MAGGLPEEHRRGAGPGSAPAAVGAEELVERYRSYLVVERGLVPETVVEYVRTTTLFLAEHPGRELKDLGVGEVSSFMTCQCRRLSQRSTERMATGMRSFLGFALREGLIAAPLAGAVPSAARWSGATLPGDLLPGR